MYGLVTQGEYSPPVNMLLQKNLQHSKQFERCEISLQCIFRLAEIYPSEN